MGLPISRPIDKLSQAPVALGLIEYAFPQLALSNFNTDLTRDRIRNVFDQLPGTPSLVITPKYAKPKTNQLVHWLRDSVSIFYISSHGAYFDVGGVANWTTWTKYKLIPYNASNYHKRILSNRYIISIPDLVRNGPTNREYSFVFADFCHSGGGSPIIRDSSGKIIDEGIAPSTPDATWANAFGIGIKDPSDESGAFLGWDGVGGDTFIGTPPVYSDATSDSWFYWRLNFFDELLQLDVYEAFSQATFHSPYVSESFYPWDYNTTTGQTRQLLVGDPFHRIN